MQSVGEFSVSLANLSILQNFIKVKVQGCKLVMFFFFHVRGVLCARARDPSPPLLRIPAPGHTYPDRSLYCIAPAEYVPLVPSWAQAIDLLEARTTGPSKVQERHGGLHESRKSFAPKFEHCIASHRNGGEDEDELGGNSVSP